MKTKKSKYTISLSRRYWIINILSLILNFFPIIFYSIKALADSNSLVVQKVALVSTLMVSVVLVVLNIMMKANLSCTKWLVLLGLFVCIKDTLLPLILIMAIVSVLDDIVFKPIKNKLKVAIISSKTMDARGIE